MGINWSVTAEPAFETGISKGVFFGIASIGTPWNGLTSVEETVSSAEPKPTYLDGRKRYQRPTLREYEATIRSFSTPDGFDWIMGHREVVPGVILTGQGRSSFNFSYQTNVGANGRRIHLIYNVTATPASHSYQTISDSVEIPDKEWKIEAVPPTSAAYRPSAHLIVDSTRMPDYIFRGVENMIYGTDGENPFMPPQDHIRNLVGNPLIEPLTEPV